MLLKSAKNYDSDPRFLNHLSVLLLLASEIQYPSEFYFQARVLTIKLFVVTQRIVPQDLLVSDVRVQRKSFLQLVIRAS